MTERQTKVLVLIGIGILLCAGTEPLAKSLAGSPPLILAGVYLLSPVGLLFLVIGIFRAATKGRQS
jgi:hypothetical protein